MCRASHTRFARVLLLLYVRCVCVRLPNNEVRKLLPCKRQWQTFRDIDSFVIALLFRFFSTTHIQRTFNSYSKLVDMVYYPRPKFIKKSDLRNAKPFKWSEIAKRADSVALHATCMRCAQDVASQKIVCDKPDDRRCKHCADHNRGGCSLVSFFWYILGTAL